MYIHMHAHPPHTSVFLTLPGLDYWFVHPFPEREDLYRHNNTCSHGVGTQLAPVAVCQLSRLQTHKWLLRSHQQSLTCRFVWGHVGDAWLRETSGRPLAAWMCILVGLGASKQIMS